MQKFHTNKMKKSNKKINIYLAASPVQLICINELRKKNDAEDFKLFLFLYKNNSYANRQMYLTLEKLGFNNYEISWIPKNKLFRFISEMFLIVKLKIKFRNRNLEFVIFDFRNLFLQSLRRYFNKSKFTLIDDGFYTFVAQENYLKNGIYLPTNNFKNLTGKIAKKLYFGASFERLKNSSFKLFSIYADEINNDLAEMNYLEWIKGRIDLSKIKFDHNKVYFIGTGMVERGTVEIEQELGLLKKLKIYWQKKGKEIFYIGKRRTSKEKLNTLKKNGIKTLIYDLPLELVVTEIEEIPAYYVTLGSTLQKSLSLILGDRIKCYFVNFEEFLRKSNNLKSTIFLDDVDIAATNYSNKSLNVQILNFEEIVS